jgi:hypothetical protein
MNDERSATRIKVARRRGALVRTGVALALGVGATLASARADAAAVHWSGVAAGYDVGAAPSVAVGWNGAPLFQMEVHQGQSNWLWQHAQNAYGNLGGSTFYTTGYYPTVGLADIETFVDIHQADLSSAPPLWYDIGNASGFVTAAGQLNQGGWYPSMAVFGGVSVRTTPLVVEVHQAQQDAGPLWLNVGLPTINAQGVWTAISSWLALNYTSGARPAISIAPTSNPNMYEFIEVHQAQSNFSQLWSAAGTLTLTPNSYILQTNSVAQFTSGNNASVAICADGIGDSWVVQVNEGPNGDLWSHTGRFYNEGTAGATFAWITGSDQHYDSGYSPKIACQRQYVPGMQGIPTYGLEVHQAAPGTNPVPLWYREFSLQ